MAEGLYAENLQKKKFTKNFTKNLQKNLQKIYKKFTKFSTLKMAFLVFRLVHLTPIISAYSVSPFMESIALTVK